MNLTPKTYVSSWFDQEVAVRKIRREKRRADSEILKRMNACDCGRCKARLFEQHQSWDVRHAARMAKLFPQDHPADVMAQLLTRVKDTA